MSSEFRVNENLILDGEVIGLTSDNFGRVIGKKQLTLVQSGLEKKVLKLPTFFTAKRGEKEISNPVLVLHHHVLDLCALYQVDYGRAC